MTTSVQRFDRYLELLSKSLGHADRHAGLRDYCTGLLLSGSRKSAATMAERMDPMRASARHQALHHFVAKAEWPHTDMLRRVAQWVVPTMDVGRGGWWSVDDTGIPKSGRHSVGVARQYCSTLGRQSNCQVAVSTSLASTRGSLPVAWQLYLPEEWAADPERRAKVGVPDEVGFATKTQIALGQLRTLLAEGAPPHCVLADAGFGADITFRQGLRAMGLHYMVGVTPVVRVRAHSDMGRPPASDRGTASARPVSVRAVAMSLPDRAFQSVTGRRDTHSPMRGRFAAVRVRPGGGGAAGHAGVRPEQWLLIEWPPNHDEPSRYFLCTLPEDTPLRELASIAHQRRRIERDHLGLRQDFGLSDYEGRGWQGLHHHAALSIAAYGYSMAERLLVERSVGV